MMRLMAFVPKIIILTITYMKYACIMHFRYFCILIYTSLWIFKFLLNDMFSVSVVSYTKRIYLLLSCDGCPYIPILTGLLKLKKDIFTTIYIFICLYKIIFNIPIRNNNNIIPTCSRLKTILIWFVCRFCYYLRSI